MIPKLTKLILLFSLQVLLPAHIALADTGPKPTMEFEFKQELTGEQVTIVSGILHECDQPDCSDASPLQSLFSSLSRYNPSHVLIYHHSPQ
jgi:hypothetical protein